MVIHPFPKYLVDGALIESLDAQIEASEDVSQSDKDTKRALLRKMFHLGNLLKDQGVSEEFIRRKLPHEAANLMIESGWGVVDERLKKVLAMWKRSTRF